MNFISRRTRSVQRPASLALLAVMAATLLGAGNAVAAEGDPMPMVLQNVSLSDISTNYGGICNGGFTTVMKSAAGPNNAVNYLNAAQRCGLKVIMSFPATVNHELGRVCFQRGRDLLGLARTQQGCRHLLPQRHQFAAHHLEIDGSGEADRLGEPTERGPAAGSGLVEWAQNPSSTSPGSSVLSLFV